MKAGSANGLEIAYLEQGTGPLVVLLHGFPDTAHTWEPTMAALATAGFRAVAPFNHVSKAFLNKIARLLTIKSLTPGKHIERIPIVAAQSF